MAIVTKTFSELDTYSPAELNRVNNNVIEMFALFATYGYSLTPAYTLRTNYSSSDWPYISDFNKTRACLKQLQDFLYVYVSGFSGPIADRLQTFGSTEANALENIVTALKAALEGGLSRMIWKISGTFRAGQDFAL